MSTERISIADAEPKQLRHFAQIAFGLDIPPTSQKQHIIAKLNEVGYTMDSIPVLSEPATGPAAPSMTSNGPRHSRMRKDGRVESCIRVEVSQLPGGSAPVFVGVNGSPLFVPRGYPVWVPDEYIEALEHAVEDHYPEYDGGAGGLDKSKKREVRSYPFSFAVPDENTPFVRSAKEAKAAAAAGA